MIKSRDKARTVLCRSRYLRYLSPFFTLRAALLFFALISLHQNAKNRKKKKKLEKRKRERERQHRHVCTEQTLSPWSWAGEGLGVGGRGGLGREGRILGAVLSQGSPCASCSQVPSEGPSLSLEPPQLLLIALECSRMALGAGIGVWEQQGHPSWSVFADVPILVPIPQALPSPRAVTDCKAWCGPQKPSLFPFHGFWERDGPGRTWSCFPQEGGWLQLGISGVICRWISPELDLCPGCHLVSMCSQCCLSIPTPAIPAWNVFIPGGRRSVHIEGFSPQFCPSAGSRGGVLGP